MYYRAVILNWRLLLLSFLPDCVATPYSSLTLLKQYRTEKIKSAAINGLCFSLKVILKLIIDLEFQFLMKSLGSRRFQFKRYNKFTLSK